MSVDTVWKYQTVKIFNTIVQYRQRYIKYCFQKHRVNVGIVSSVSWKSACEMLLASIRTPVTRHYVFVVRFDGDNEFIYLFNTVQTLVHNSIKHVTFSDPSTGLVSFVIECNINKVLLKIYSTFYCLHCT